MNRMEIFNRVDDERVYQTQKYGDPSRSELNFLLLIEQYVEKAKRAAVYEDRDTVLERLREIIAIGVAAAEQHGIDYREWDRQ